MGNESEEGSPQVLTMTAPEEKPDSNRFKNGDSTASSNGFFVEGLVRRDSRFGGLGAAVEVSMAESIEKDLGNYLADYPVTAEQLSKLSNDRSREALIEVLETIFQKEDTDLKDDVENPSPQQRMYANLHQLVDRMKRDVANGPFPEHSPEYAEAVKDGDLAANILTALLLRSSPETGIDPREVEHRREFFGSNALTEKKLDSFLLLCWEAIQDFVLIMLIVLGVISIVVEIFTHNGHCTTCWIEGAAILVSVCIVVFVTAGIDYAKQFAFVRLNKSLHETNTKAVIRDGKQVSVTDDDIVVGDVLSVNSHSLASIPADCVLLGPVTDLKMDESTLTGEGKAITKRPGDVVLSGTNAIQGSSKMVVIAVGVNSVAGKIKARVYQTDDDEDGLNGEDENSPLFVKLDLIAKQIGIAGTVFACLSFVASCIIGLGIRHDKPVSVVQYLITAITVLAVAVPEGLPLAVTLALAFSSSKMTKDKNLVKHLDACETMGCATTICTDKTGKYSSTPFLPWLQCNRRDIVLLATLTLTFNVCFTVQEL